MSEALPEQLSRLDTERLRGYRELLDFYQFLIEEIHIQT